MSAQFHDAFVGEHRENEHLLKELKELARQHEWEVIHQHTLELSRNLKNHINAEEQYVYPVIERRMKDEELLRTLAILRKRHIEIPNYVLEIEENAQDADQSETLSAIELLERVLVDHHRTEESDIFPLFDRDGPLFGSSQAAVMALKKGNDQ